MTELFALIQAHMADVLQVEPELIRLATRRDALAEWDSFNHLMLMMELEKRMNIAFRTEEIQAVHTVADLLKVVEEAKGR